MEKSIRRVQMAGIDSGEALDPSIEIRLLADPASIGASQRLRYDVWSNADASIRIINENKIADLIDDVAFHWAAFAQDLLVASARLSIHSELASAPDSHLFKDFSVPTPVASINRMVVRPEYRRRGIARAIDRLRIQKARECGCKTIIAAPVKETASLSRLRSYGFIFIDVDGTVDWGDVADTAAYLPLNAQAQSDP